MREGDTLQLRELKPEQKFTQPPPRYSEATLVKALEETASGAEYVCLDYQRHPGPRLREQDRRAVQAHGARPHARRPAAEPGVRRYPRRRVHENLEEDLDKIEEGTSNYAKTLGASTRSSRRI